MGNEPVAQSGFSVEHGRLRQVFKEDHVTHLDKRRYMVWHGCRLLMRTGLNSWYVPAKTSYSACLKARLEYLTKHDLGLPLRRRRYWLNSCAEPVSMQTWPLGDNN